MQNMYRKEGLSELL